MPSSPVDLYLMRPDTTGRCTCIVYPPFDREGKEVTVYNGIKVPHDFCFDLAKTKRGVAHDFLWNLRGLLIVSERTKDLVSRFRIADTDVYPVRLFKKDGTLLQQYFWLNVRTNAALLDMQYSKYVRSRVEGFLRIDRFVIDQANIPSQDLFQCEETGLHIFSSPLVDAILQAGFAGARFLPLADSSWPG